MTRQSNEIPANAVVDINNKPWDGKTVWTGKDTTGQETTRLENTRYDGP